MLKERTSTTHDDERLAPSEKRSSYVFRPTRDELRAEGKNLRQKCPRSAHAVWHAPDDRPDPVRLMEGSSQGRIPELIPIRYGRMLQSPFTFYRGAALNMAADLPPHPRAACAFRLAVTAIC